MSASRRPVPCEPGSEAAGLTAPLSFAQQRLWFLDRLGFSRSVYNIPYVLRLKGLLDEAALRASIEEIVRRHDALRTTFPMRDDGQPVQLVAPELPVPVPVEDLRAVPDEERRARADALAREEALRGFDLAEGPLLAARLLRLADEEHELLLTFHHIVFDGWSEGVLVEELSRLYDAFRGGHPSPLPELPVQYPAFAAAQRERLTGERLEEELAYWRAQLAGAPASLDLPFDFPRPAVQSFRGALQPVAIPRGVEAALKALAKEERVSPFMTYLAAFAALLGRHTHQDDILVGCPIAGRERPESAPLIGLFANTLVMRCRVTGDPTFRELLGSVRDTALDAYEHHDVPFERLVGELHPERSLSRSPLFQVTFALQSSKGAGAFPGLQATLEQSAVPDTAKFDLSLYLVDSPAGLSGWIEYATDLFEARTIARVATRFEVLLEGMARTPDTPIAVLPLLPEDERRLVVDEWNATAAPVPDGTALDLFEAEDRRRPDAVAVSFAGRTLTYGELDARASRLARAIRARTGGAERVVGVLARRSPELVVAALAAWKAGAAYLPLDPSSPPERLALLAKDADVPLILTDGSFAAELPAGTAEVLRIDARVDDGGAPEIGPAPSPRRLAYVIYTSGSTGFPKGVEIEHRALMNLVAWHRRAYGITEADRTTLVASPAFDASVWEIWPTLASGASLHIPEDDVRDDPARLVAFLASEEITVAFLPTPLAEAVLDESLPRELRLRALLTGGDRLRRGPEDPLPFRLVNHYGPTESTVVSTAGDVAPGDEGAPSIGRPIANTQAFLLDRNLAPVPIGVVGELFVGGEGLARGYRGRPELTAERFVASPFGRGRLYRTGDLARFRASGELEFVSRADRQVKVRGVRIEPGEVEAALSRHPGVRECVVTARGEGAGRRLVAYLVARGEAPGAAELKRHLQETLPESFVPASYVLLRTLPLTPNGKLDRDALPEPAGSEPAVSAEPRDDVERRLAALFAEHLGVSRVGVDDDYFERGGHSLMAARLFARIEKELGKRLPLATIFQAPTVARLAALLREETYQPSWASLVPIHPEGTRPPFYCVHAAGGNVLTYFDLARRLGEDQPVYGLQAQGLDGRSPLPSTIEEMAASYVAEIRAFQPRGPYHIGGSSAGGLVAYEMAQQLLAAGEEVGLLALFDTWGPDYRELPGMGPLKTRIARLVERVDLHTGNFLVAEGMKEKLSYVVTKSGRVKKDLLKIARRAVKNVKQSVASPMPRDLRRVENASRRAVDQYVPKPYAGRITLFRATKQPAGYEPDPELGWSRMAIGGVDVHEVAGYHGAIVYEPRVGALAEKLSAALASTPKRDSPRRRPPSDERAHPPRLVSPRAAPVP